MFQMNKFNIHTTTIFDEEKKDIRLTKMTITTYEIVLFINVYMIKIAYSRCAY